MGPILGMMIPTREDTNKTRTHNSNRKVTQEPTVTITELQVEKTIGKLRTRKAQG